MQEISSPNRQADIIRVENQAVAVMVDVKTARFSVWDLVARVRWRMDPYLAESGRLVFTSTGPEARNDTYLLGTKGDRGVLFHHKASLIRSDAEDDYSSLTLEGALGDDQNSQVEIEFLVSEAFPTLDLLLRVNGQRRDELSQISFPVGMAATIEESADLIVPRSSEPFLNEYPAEIARRFQTWRLSPGHVIHGRPFFAITKLSRKGRPAACLGFLNCPHAEIDARADETLSVATPGTRNARAALDDLSSDYSFRYQFVPDATPEAIAWLWREYVLERAL